MALSEEYTKSVADSTLKQRAYKAFELEKYDKESVNEIKKYLKLKKYTTRKMVIEHRDYLEKLANKIQNAISLEKKEGEITWELEHDLNEIKRLFDEVDAILDSFNEKVEWNREKKQED